MFLMPRPETTRSNDTRPFERFAKVAQQGDLAVVARGEVGMAAFGRQRPVRLAVPHQQRLAQPGAGRDQPAVPDAGRVAGVQGEDGVRRAPGMP